MCDWPHNGTFWKANHTGAASFCGGVPTSLRWQTKVTSLPSPPTTISRIMKERNSHLLTVTQSFFRDEQIKQCGRYGMRKSEKKKNELLRQWLLPQAAERLKKEEGFNQSVNRFSEEDYKLTRNPSLFGIPGAWEAEELQLLLEEAKENSALQVIMYNGKAEGESFRNTEIPEENLHDSEFQWINTLHQTENAILDNQESNIERDKLVKSRYKRISI